MKCSLPLFLAALAGFQLTVANPTGDRAEFFANVDYNQVVSHMKELLMYMPVLMTTIKETMVGFPKVAEGLNNIQAKRLHLGSGHHNDGKCRCRHLSGDSRTKDDDYR